MGGNGLERGRSFRSAILAGFECSSHRRPCGQRLDLIASTRHDRHAFHDYKRLQDYGIYAVRDGIRWHLIETAPYRYDFSSVLPMLRAAQAAGTQVMWDLFHYGWPDDLDIFAPAFIDRLSALAREFARVHGQETGERLYFCPVNEISFVAWGAGETAYINPFARGRGNELKRQLVRAAIEATEAVWTVAPGAQVVQIDPVIHIIPASDDAEETREVEAYNEVQYAAWDMLAGRLSPELGGNEKYLGVIGANFYPKNEWIHGGGPIGPGHPRYRPLREMLRELWQRYRRPIFLAETGTEDEARGVWLDYIADEVIGAIEEDVPVEGICLYPIISHLGWDDDRRCYNGLFDYCCSDSGERCVYEPLAQAIRRQGARLEAAWRQVERKGRTEVLSTHWNERRTECHTTKADGPVESRICSASHTFAGDSSISGPST